MLNAKERKKWVVKVKQPTGELFHGDGGNPKQVRPLIYISVTYLHQNIHKCEVVTSHHLQSDTPSPKKQHLCFGVFFPGIETSAFLQKSDHTFLAEKMAYQIDFSCCLERVEQVHNKWTFTERQSISLCPHLLGHIFINHVSFIYDL